MSKTFRAICKVLNWYYDYQDRYEFTLKQLSYYKRQKIKFDLRLNRRLDKLDNCRILKIYDKWVTKYITKLDIGGWIYQYISLPILQYEITKLKSLTFLDIHCHKLKYLPSTIGNLKSLIHLDLSYNQLTYLPETIGNLKSLIFLNLHCNQLTYLPETIGNLKSLIVLCVSNNQLTYLPETINNLTSLKNLLIDDNPIIENKYFILKSYDRIIL